MNKTVVLFVIGEEKLEEDGDTWSSCRLTKIDFKQTLYMRTNMAMFDTHSTVV